MPETKKDLEYIIELMGKMKSHINNRRSQVKRRKAKMEKIKKSINSLKSEYNSVRRELLSIENGALAIANTFENIEKILAGQKEGRSSCAVGLLEELEAQERAVMGS